MAFAFNPVTGKLDKVTGIGDPVPSGTSGSVLFVDSSGNLAQDNTNLYFDDTNNELRLGGASTQDSKIAIRTEAADNSAIYVDADTTKFNQPSDIYTGIYINGGVTTTGTGYPVSMVGFRSFLTNSANISAIDDEQGWVNYGFQGNGFATGNVSYSPISSNAEYNYGLYYSFSRSGTATNTAHTMQNFGADLAALTSFSYNNAGGTFVEQNTGARVSASGTGTATSGTLTRTNKGLDVSVFNAGSGSITSTNYGIYLALNSGATNNWGIYDNAGAQHWIKGNTLFGSTAATPSARLEIESASTIAIGLVTVKKDAGTELVYRPSADSDAARGTALLAAQTAAASGDTIYVGPGTYSPSSALGKNGVNWWFAPGAIVSTSFTSGQWTDGGSDLTFSIGGFGRFIATGANGSSVFNPQGANSTWTVHGVSAECTSASESTPVINPAGAGGEANHTFIFTDYIRSNGYDAIWNNGNAGTVYIRAPLIQGGGNAVEVQSGNPFGDPSITIVEADRIEKTTADTQAAIYIWSGDQTFAYIRCREIQGNTVAIETEGTIVAEISADTINGKVQHEGGTVRINGATIDTTGQSTVSVIVSGSGLTLKDVNIITDSGQTNSLTSTSNTVTIAGTLKMNKPPDSDTVFTGGVLFDASVSQFQYPHTLVPKSSDGAALGTGSLMFSDLFLASGSIVNFNNGNVTLTHSAGLLTLVGGDLVVPTESYGSGWSSDNSVPTKDAVYDRLEVMKIESFIIAIGDETTAITTGTAKVTFRMPYAFTLTAVRASLTTSSSSGNPTFDINESGTTILSTKLSIDSGEKTSTTAATAAVISDTSLADDAEMTIDVDTAGTGAAGAKIYLIGYKT